MSRTYEGSSADPVTFPDTLDVVGTMEMTSPAPLEVPGSCPYCSSPGTMVLHGGGKCPRVKSFEYHPNGALKKVKFFGGG